MANYSHQCGLMYSIPKATSQSNTVCYKPKRSLVVPTKRCMGILLIYYGISEKGMFNVANKKKY